MNAGRVRKGIAFLALVVGVLLTSAGSLSAANGSWHLSGGGTASFSQVAMNVTIDGSGSAHGSFECLMAGRSAFVLGGFGLAHNMIVHATPSSGSVSGSTVTFLGTGSLTLDGRQKMDPIHILVQANVASQSFQLTVDELNLTMDVETLDSGHISLK